MVPAVVSAANHLMVNAITSGTATFTVVKCHLGTCATTAITCTMTSSLSVRIRHTVMFRWRVTLTQCRKYAQLLVSKCHSICIGDVSERSFIAEHGMEPSMANSIHKSPQGPLWCLGSIAVGTPELLSP